MKQLNIEEKKLRRFAENIFKSIGCPSKDARLAADVLISADLSGIDSHGVARLTGYIALFEHGRLNPTPDIKIIHQSPSTVVIDGDRGLGLVVAPYAMKLIIKKAGRAGTAWAAIRNSNHFGIAGYHASLALSKDMIGWAMTNAAPLAVPTFAKERMLGTNPIAVAVPAGTQPSFLADFATTAVSYGKLEILQRQHEPAPLGWVQDYNGSLTTDAHAIKNGGGLMPLGGGRESGGHKGFALASIVDILSGVLSGANFGPWVPPFATAGFHGVKSEESGLGTGHFLGAMRIDAFQTAADFKSKMDQWIERFRNAMHVDGQEVVIPGDPERISKEFRMRNGIPLQPKVKEALLALGEQQKVKL